MKENYTKRGVAALSIFKHQWQALLLALMMSVSVQAQIGFICYEVTSTCEGVGGTYSADDHGPKAFLFSNQNGNYLYYSEGYGWSLYSYADEELFFNPFDDYGAPATGWIAVDASCPSATMTVELTTCIQASCIQVTTDCEYGSGTYKPDYFFDGAPSLINENEDELYYISGGGDFPAGWYLGDDTYYNPSTSSTPPTTGWVPFGSTCASSPITAEEVECPVLPCVIVETDCPTIAGVYSGYSMSDGYADLYSEDGNDIYIYDDAWYLYSYEDGDDVFESSSVGVGILPPLDGWAAVSGGSCDGYTISVSACSVETVCTPPSVTCPPSTSINNTAGQCSAIATWVAPTITGDCSPTATSNIASGAVLPVGANVVKYTVTNSSSQSATCTFTVTVNVSSCPMATGLTAGSITNNAATISWNPLSCATKYSLFTRRFGQTPAVWKQYEVLAPAASRNLTSLVANSKYGARIRTSCSSSQTSTIGAEKTFTTLAAMYGTEDNTPEAAEQTKGSTEPSVSVYPNPSNGHFNLDIADMPDQPISIVVSDNSGRTAMAWRTNVQNTRLFEPFDLSDLPAGLYILRLKLDDGSTIIRTVIKN